MYMICHITRNSKTRRKQSSILELGIMIAWKKRQNRKEIFSREKMNRDLRNARTTELGKLIREKLIREKLIRYLLNNEFG